jgi:O-antigen/teichoic acid export membrane protein
MIGVVFARVDGPHAVGLFALAIGIAAPVITLSQICLRQVMITDVRQRYAFGDYLSLRRGLTVVAVAVCACVVLALGYRGAQALTLLGFAIGRAFESISDIYYGRLQVSGRLDKVARYLVLRAALTLIVTSVVCITTRSLVAAALGFACASMLSQYIVQRVERTVVDGAGGASLRRRGRWDRLYMSSLASRSAPLTSSQFFVSLNYYAPRLIVERLRGSVTLGQFAALDYLLSIGLLVVAALGQATSPALARAFHEGDYRRFWRITVLGTLITAGVGLGIILVSLLWGSVAINAIYGARFGPAVAALGPFMVGGAVSLIANILAYSAINTGIFRGLTWRYALVFAVTGAACYFGVSAFGLPGVGFGLGCGGCAGIAVTLGFLVRATANSSGRRARGALAT